MIRPPLATIHPKPVSAKSAPPKTVLTVAQKKELRALQQNFANALAATQNDPQRTMQVLGLSAADAEAFLSLGSALLEAGRNEEAMAAAEVATACAPKAPGGWQLWGCALARLGRTGDAVAAFARALALGGDDVQTLTDLAECHIVVFDYAAAAKALERAIKADPQAQTPAGFRAQALLMRTLMKLEG